MSRYVPRDFFVEGEVPDEDAEVEPLLVPLERLRGGHRLHRRDGGIGIAETGRQRGVGSDPDLPPVAGVLGSDRTRPRSSLGKWWTDPGRKKVKLGWAETLRWAYGHGPANRAAKDFFFFMDIERIVNGAVAKQVMFVDRIRLGNHITNTHTENALCINIGNGGRIGVFLISL